MSFRRMIQIYAALSLAEAIVIQAAIGATMAALILTAVLGCYSLTLLPRRRPR